MAVVVVVAFDTEVSVGTTTAALVEEVASVVIVDKDRLFNEGSFFFGGRRVNENGPTSETDKLNGYEMMMREQKENSFYLDVCSNGRCFVWIPTNLLNRNW